MSGLISITSGWYCSDCGQTFPLGIAMPVHVCQPTTFSEHEMWLRREVHAVRAALAERDAEIERLKADAEGPPQETIDEYVDGCIAEARREERKRCAGIADDCAFGDEAAERIRALP